MAESRSESQAQMGGPASVASALHVLDRHARTLVGLALAQHSVQGGDIAEGVVELHDRLSQLLHAISLEHGTDAMSTAAEYAARAQEAGSLYPGDELETFLRDVAAGVRATAKDLTKSTPFGS
ncbi:MAG: hypothetical protein JWL76_1079 [Thermoleophilia bacterium]|nr:hypothetical protein [Thermoleophilia bacterium]